ncbi:zinc-dependent alcohol dehydrogenase family protein [Saccharicrinis sp. FJH54]|uniref:zinc-dependent alcohol dehydrogenase family protein n=1 Tax=Saccharicrinis sp. FJH54 TaxID=3344665 RepID=UPI0035D3E3B5
MKAWVIDKITDLSGDDVPLTMKELPRPEPDKGEVLLKVKVCGICHTELDEIEGRTAPPDLPVVPGHQVVGIIEKHRGIRKDIKLGDRVGVGWIYSACGHCEYCKSGNENLCKDFLATGRDRNGGYAEYMKVPEQSVHKIPDMLSDSEAAPLLCAGAIGFRSVALSKISNGNRIGLTGFGASAHLVLKMILHQYPDSDVFVFARNPEERKFALDLGCKWAGNTSDKPLEQLHAIIDTTPVWKPVISALECLRPGGRLVINAIRKEDHDIDLMGKISYEKHLWMEKEIKSVANVAGSDLEAILDIAADIPLKAEVTVYPFDKANEALLEIKRQKIKGAKVLSVSG